MSRLLSLGYGIVIVSDSYEDHERLDPRARASITSVISLSAYTPEQAFEIIAKRAELALRELSCTDSLIRKVVERSKGNMELGINLLKTAALKAESQKKEMIDEADIPLNNCLEPGLSIDERILLSILKEQKSLPSNRLYALYKEEARNPKGDRSLRNYMRKLCSKGFVRTIGEKRGGVYEIASEDDM